MQLSSHEVLIMDWLLIVILILFAAFGYLLMDKIDLCLTTPEVFPDKKALPPEGSPAGGTLIFGRLAVADEIAAQFERLHIPYHKIRSLDELLTSQSYRFLIAVDSDDLENLTVCVVSRKMMSIQTLAAVCNNRESIRLYEEHLIPFMPIADLNVSALTALIFPQAQPQQGRMDA